MAEEACATASKTPTAIMVASIFTILFRSVQLARANAWVHSYQRPSRPDLSRVRKYFRNWAFREKSAAFNRWYEWMPGRVCGSIRVTAHEPERRRFHRHARESARPAPRRGGPAKLATFFRHLLAAHPRRRAQGRPHRGRGAGGGAGDGHLGGEGFIGKQI